MAKAKKTAREVAAAAAEAAVDALSEEREIALERPEGDEDELIGNVLDGLRQLEGGEEARWRVTCVRPLKNKGHIDELRTDQLTPQYFSENYGPGLYRVAGFDARGQYIRGASAKIEISELAARDVPRGTPEAPASAMDRYLAELDRRDRERARDRKELYLALGGPLITAASGLVTALLSRPAIDPNLLVALRPQSNIGELTTALSSLDQLRGGGSDQLETLFGILERVRDLPEGKGGDESWVSVIKELLPQLAEMRRARAAQAQGQRGPGPQAPFPQHGRPPLPGSAHPPAPQSGAPATPPSSSVSTSARPQASPPSAQPVATSTSEASSQASSAMPSHAASPPSEGNPMLDRVLPWLRRQAANLEDWAAADLDPGEMAETLLDSIPGPFRKALTVEQLRALIGRPDWWTQLVQFHPSLAPYQEWVAEGHIALLAIIDEELAAARGSNGADPPQARTEPKTEAGATDKPNT